LRFPRTIPPVTTRRWRPRAAALLAGGAFALHQLRYLLGYSGRSHHELAAQGHAYMTFVAPLVAAVLLLAAADVVARLAGARGPGSAGAPAPCVRRLWAVTAGFLFFAYCFQESLEGALVTGHPGGLAGVLGHGGWEAAPLAAAIGLVVALALRTADGAIELAAEPELRVRLPRPQLTLAVLPTGHARGGRLVGRQLGARAPPLASIP